MVTSRDAGGRYERLQAAPLIGAEGLAALRSRQVAILGVGNVGWQLAQHLVLLGVRLILVDRDIVEPPNLGTQGFAEEDIGLPKVRARSRSLGALNPGCPIKPMHVDVNELGLGALRDADLIYSCLDNAPIRVVVNEIAFRLGVPWIDGAVDGSGRTLFGRVAVHVPGDSGGGCYICPMTTTILARLMSEGGDAAGCAALASADDTERTAPTLSVSALGGAVASIQAAWGLGVLLRRTTIVGREVYFDLDAGRMTAHRLRRNPRCLFDHQRFSLVPLGKPPELATVAATFDAAERRLGAPVTLELQRRMVSDPRGGGSLDRFGRDEAAPFMSRTWAELGIPPADVVVATRNGSQLHLLLDAE